MTLLDRRRAKHKIVGDGNKAYPSFSLNPNLGKVFDSLSCHHGPLRRIPPASEAAMPDIAVHLQLSRPDSASAVYYTTPRRLSLILQHTVTVQVWLHVAFCIACA